MLGKRIGNYQVVRQIDKGGMGAVFEAVHESIGKHVAIKVLHSHFSQDAQIGKRFFNEAKAVTSIGHPGIVQVFDFGQMETGQPYIVMEYLAGESLSRRLKRAGPMLVVPALRLARQMASALAAAHAHKVVHRDLKPGNVIIVPDPEAIGGERAKILDFGIAKMMEECNETEEEATEFKTRTGMLIGTPTYMSPEQCRGAGRVDERTDVYALGVILYQMLSGRPPFIAEGDGEVMAMHIYEAPVPLRERSPAVPLEAAELIQQMLLKSPAQRPDMADVAQGLEGLQLKLSGAVSAVFALPVPLRPGQSGTHGAMSGRDVSHVGRTGHTGAGGEADSLTEAVEDSYASISITPTPAATRVHSSTASRHGAGERVDQTPPPRRRRGMVLWFSLAIVLVLGGAVLGTMLVPAQTGPSDSGRPAPPPIILGSAARNTAAPPVQVTPLVAGPPAPSPSSASPAAEPEPTPSPSTPEKKRNPERSHRQPRETAPEAAAPQAVAVNEAPARTGAVPPVNPPTVPLSTPAPAPTKPPVAPAPSAQPRMLPAFVIRKDKIAGEMPHLPDYVKARHVNARGSYRICIDRTGHVSGITTLSSIPGADAAITSTLHGWAYKPPAVPFCFVETFDFDVR